MDFCNKLYHTGWKPVSTLTWHHEHKPQEPHKSRWPRERNTEQSAPTNARHTQFASRQLGTSANQRYDIHWDQLWDACLLARVRWGTRETCQCGHASLRRWGPWCRPSYGEGFNCKGICCKEEPHYCIRQSARNLLEKDQVQKERFGNHPEAVLRQATINLDSQVWKSFEDSLHKMYRADLAEAYVMQESTSSRLMCCEL